VVDFRDICPGDDVPEAAVGLEAVEASADPGDVVGSGVGVDVGRRGSHPTA